MFMMYENFELALHDITVLNQQSVRKAFVSESEDKLSSDYIEILNSNTKNNAPGHENWYNIYNIAHRILLLEVDSLNAIKKADAKSKLPEYEIKFFEYILKSSLALLKTENLVEHIAKVLYDVRYKRIRHVYISVLFQVFKDKNHVENIKLHEWQSLLTKCLDSFQEEENDYHRLHHIYALQGIIKYGCLYTKLVTEVAEKLKFLVKLLKNFSELNDKFSYAIFHLTLTVCQALSLENRFELCKFGEIILPNMITIKYIKTEDGDVYDLFLILIRAHHPKAIHTYQDAVHNFDDLKWRRILAEMRTLLFEQCKHNNYESLIKLSCEVFTITSNGFNVPNTPDFVPTTMNNLPLFASLALDFATGYSENSCTYISVLIRILKRYPECLRDEDFVPILANVSKVLQSPFNSKKFLFFIRLIVILMDLEKFVFANNRCKKAEYYWNQIWDEWPKILVEINNIPDSLKIDYYELLQRFIIYSNLYDPTKFLTHYQAEITEWSPVTVSVLLLFCQYLPLETTDQLMQRSAKEMEIFSIYWELMNWSLFVPWDKLDHNFPFRDLSELLICLALKHFQKRPDNDPLRVKIMQRFDSVVNLDDDIEKCYISLLTPIECSNDDKKTIIDKKHRLLFHTKNIKQLDRLISEVLKLITEEDDFKTLILKTILIIRFTSDLVDNIAIEKEQLYQLIRRIQISLQLINEQVTGDAFKRELNKYTNISSGIIVYVKILRLIFKAASSKTIAVVVIDGISKEFFQSIRNFLSLNIKLDSDRNKIQESISLLELSFSCLESENDITELQKNVIKEHLNINNYNFAHDFVTMKVVCNAIIHSNSEQHFGREIFEELVIVCTKFYEHSYKNIDIAHWLFNVIPILYVKVKNINGNMMTILQTVFIIHKKIEEKYYGLETHFKFTKLLCNLVTLEPTIILLPTNTFPSTMNTSFEEMILAQFRSSFFSIRFQIVQLLHYIFGSDEIDYAWKKKFFDQLKSIALNLLKVPTEITAVEKISRIASVTYIISKPIVYGSYFRNEAVHFLLSLQVKNNINERNIIKIVNISSREKNCHMLIENHLKYFLSKWITSGNSLQNFPFSILSCTSEVDFYTKYLKEVFNIVIINLPLDYSVQFCQKLNIRYPQALLTCFIDILPWLIMERKTNHTAKELYINSLGPQADNNLRKSLMENISSVILKITEKLHDSKNFADIFKIEIDIPENDNLQLDLSQWKYCIVKLLKCVLKVNENLDELLILKYSKDLVKILVNLPKQINSSNQLYVEEKLKCLHQYVSFIDLILLNIDDPRFDETSTFIIQTTCFNLLNLFEHEYLVIAECACKYLNIFLHIIVPKKCYIIGEIYSILVNSLVELTKRQTKNKDAMKTLRYLIINQEEIFKQDISKLSCFPKDDHFLEFNTIWNKWRGNSDLKEEITLFLEDSSQLFYRNRVEAVRYLTNEINLKKKELHIMQNNSIQQRGNLINEPSLIELLIVRIIHMLKNTTSPQLQLACVECLDAIGPVKFRTKSIYTANIAQSSKGFLTLTYNTILHVSQYLASSDFDLRKAVIDFLYSISSSIWTEKMFHENFLDELEQNKNSPQLKLPVKILYPFLTSEDTLNRPNIVINIARLKEIFNAENDFWTMNAMEEYATWIVNLTCETAKCVTHFEEMNNIFKFDPYLCEIFFPEFIHSLLSTKNNLLPTFCEGFNIFFIYHFGEDHKPKCHYRIVEMMLNCVDYVKLHVPPTEKLQIDLIAITRAAMYISSHIRGLYYAEMACVEFLKENWQTGQSYKLRELDILDNESGTKLQRVIRELCIQIGDIDMFYGCRLMFDNEPESLKKYYTYLRQWDKLIPLEDVALKYDEESLKEIVYSLQQNGLDWMAQIASSWGKEEIQNWQYEQAWRLADWSKLDQFKSKKSSAPKPSFEFVYLKALRNFSLNCEDKMNECLHKARLLIIEDFYNQSIDNVRTIYPKLCRLQMLREMEKFTEAKKTNHFEDLFTNWKHFDKAEGCDFHDLENVLLQRRLLCNLSDVSKNPNLQNEIQNTYIMLSTLAREQGFINKAIQELDIVTINNNMTKEQTILMQFQQALTAAARDETVVAMLKFRNLTLEEDIDSNLKAKALIAYGDKVTELRFQNPLDTSVIYSEAYEILKSQTSYDCVMKAQIIIAKYADARYQELLEYATSSEYISFRQLIESSKPESDVKSVKDTDVKKTIIILNKQYEEDCKNIEALDKNRNDYMMQALNNYLDVLAKTDTFDSYMARVITIWFRHKNDSDANRVIFQRLSSIASYKFVPLVRQIAPNLRSDNSLFSQNIRTILKKTTLDHPYHCVPILLMLQNYQLDAEYFNDDDSLQAAIKPKVYAAKEMIKQLMGTSIGRIVRESDAIAKALISIAYVSVDRGVQMQDIPHTHSILKIKDYKYASVPTVTVELKKNADYSQGIIGVRCYLPKIKLVGGINAPKVLRCVGMDGKKREELIKGRDDMRQDAIMQQLFKEVNSILDKDEQAQKRNLHIRTYKIVPLTQRSGVVEWCRNSKPIISILIGSDSNPGLHEKYFPNDEKSSECKAKMKRVSNSTNERKLTVYNECCKLIHPAFQYFFVEKFSSPQSWFEHRLIYTKSVAASSIVGYIVGLGDRHLSNILLDVETCEVIHIDFGIAFEQGSVLSVPETVPFRLTRDIEAGMGILAVDGILRRCCEVTLEALRNKHDVLIMLLKVVLYDPLFQWLITEENTDEMPDSSFSSWRTINKYNASNQPAQRALARVQQRIQGLDRGTILSTSVQVAKLLQEARDPKNLCLLFVGWQPFL